MKTTEEVLTEHRIRLRSTALGDHHTTCPQCSHLRKKKSQPCLSVTIKPDGVVFHCHHCGWSGGGGGTDKPASKPREAPKRPTYADLQRKGWAAWRR